MAAGLGTRMRSNRPKHLHPLLGRRLLDWVVDAVKPLALARLIVVVSPESEAEVMRSLPEGIEVAVQREPRGTGDAVAAARDRLADFQGDVLVVAGDSPLLTSSLLEELIAAHRREGAGVTVLSIEPDGDRPYGRILRDEKGDVSAIVEEGDATPEQLEVRELNASTYVFAATDLWSALDRLDASNAQGELYLTDAIRHLVADGRRAAVYPAPDPRAGDGVNTRDDLAQAAAALRERILREHMLAGVTVVDPATTWIEADVEIEPEAVIHPFTVLRGRTVVRAHAEVGPHAVVVDSEIGPGAVVGPFTYLRPGAVLGAEAKIGAFVEVKNSTLGERVKVPHLSYIGDAEIGEGTNIGAGAITANYRPEQYDEKQRTVIGRDVHTGSDNVFVAPVEIGDHAWIAAGSTITEDVPPGALAIARTKQVNKENYRGGNRDD
jgi:bifunctional UDP-N-acetylglucosamine pyrophosphorylase / glucosamine-1-phosphate N-acetyltransferase